MSELRELYQEVILDHSKSPRHFRELEDAQCRSVGHNPLCGDKLTVYVKLDGDTIEEAAFRGSGCAISMASASMMTEALKGKTIEQAREMFGGFHELVTAEGGARAPESLGKLIVFSGVREFPMRVKCATLAWHTLRAALDLQDKAVSTE